MCISSPASQPSAPSPGHSCKPFLWLRPEALSAVPGPTVWPGAPLTGRPVGFVSVPASAVHHTWCPGSNIKLITFLCFGD